VVASSHPSHRERKSEWETTSRSRAGHSRWPTGRTDITTVFLESQPQRTAGTTTSPPVAVGLDAALLAARQLLNNPPPTGASPSAAKQWRHDVDQLVAAAINTTHHERRCQPSAQQSHFPSVVRAPSVAQAPPVLVGARSPVQHSEPMASYKMMEIREEINRRRGGEDSRTIIDSNRERRRDINGRNLERDFDLHAPVGACQVIHAPLPLAPGSFRGCMALAPDLRMVVWPPKFLSHLPEKYNETVNPAKFLQIYSTSILAVGRNEAVMANYFPIALMWMARSWLMNLPKGTLHSWSDLCHQFTANIESAYTRPGNETDLHAIQQHPGESLRSFV
jgi:hypothetical protein